MVRTAIIGMGITGYSCLRYLAEVDELVVVDTRSNPPDAGELAVFCGALIGATNNGTRSVATIVPLDNRRSGSSARRRFLVTGEDYRALETTATQQQSEIIGFYHSHPDHPARPSEYDREHAFPWYAYVIVSVTDGRAGDVRCWTLRDDRSGFEDTSFGM